MNTIDTAVGAFLGAFFAYLFMRIRDVFTKIYERHKDNFNALVRLEHLCCENMDTIANNIWIIDDFHNTVGEALKQGHTAIYGNRLHKLSFPEDIILKLTGIDFMNEVLSYKVDFSRLNNDIDTINVTYDSFKNALLGGTIDVNTYRVNAQFALDKSLELKYFLSSLEDKTIRINAYTRILCREQRPLLTKIVLLTLRKKIFTDRFNSKVAKEIEEIKKGREEVSARSKKELEEIKKKQK